MIDKIVIKSKASYDENGVTLDNLKEVNFIYGANGSGKTTISDALKNTTRYSQCQVSWVNNSELGKVVYNKEFIEENFHQSTQIKGIFTLGQESHEIRQKIEQQRVSINKLDAELDRLDTNLRNKKAELDQNEVDYGEQCWVLKQKYDDCFAEAFTGFMGSKKRFRDKCKVESQNKNQLETLEELKKKCGEIFGGEKEKVEVLNKLEHEQYLIASRNEIFKTKPEIFTVECLHPETQHRARGLKN